MGSGKTRVQKQLKASTRNLGSQVLEQSHFCNCCSNVKYLAWSWALFHGFLLSQHASFSFCHLSSASRESSLLLPVSAAGTPAVLLQPFPSGAFALLPTAFPAPSAFAFLPLQNRRTGRLQQGSHYSRKQLSDLTLSLIHKDSQWDVL